ncbi:carph-isopro domain-containing protein [Novosphingobium sp. P6W]|uniref:carph-isopro domain-containing protein n=1 Tax=Novosphingobium sp. P6W TaxID=1609758 RepID=UPI0005C2ED3B|nr:hypothetical protein [Novosphingobium sp. P6W]AXB75453.1 hypothetical protein TQ38_002115 [Novosphingobium sp. P6W]KIS32518.1 hypothetical protein TQ38_09295 [Novosphingobium sp. P6W]
MERLISIFDLFGGIRPMARALDESPSKIMAWKRAGHIPAQKQAEVLEKGLALGMPLTAEHMVFPLGHPVPEVAAMPVAVVCHRQGKAQRSTGAQ